jgi:hypothetical protein
MFNMFRELSPEEEAELRQWARDHHHPGEEIREGIWHPIVVAECMRIDNEEISAMREAWDNDPRTAGYDWPK